MPITVSGSVREGNSFDLFFDQKLTTSDGTVVVRSLIESATLKITLRDNPAQVVNNRSALDVIESFDEEGKFLLELDPADAVILSTKGICQEVHVATLTVVLAGPPEKTFIDELEFIVTNLATIP